MADFDEAVVIDSGACQWRCGYASDEGPGTVLPGVPVDAAGYKTQLLAAFEEMELESPGEYGLIISEAPGVSASTRRLIAAAVFSTGVGHVHFAAAPLLAMFSRGFDTGILVDVGHRHTHVYAVFAGHCPLPIDAAAAYALAGAALDWKDAPPSCTSLFEAAKDEAAAGGDDKAGGVHEAIWQTVRLADISLQGALLANVVCVGGGSLATEFPHRLERKLRSKLTHTPRLACDLHVLANADRRFASWMGGSMFASIPSNKQMFLSPSELDATPSELERRSAPLACLPLAKLRARCQAAASDEAANYTARRNQSASQVAKVAEDARAWWLEQAPSGSLTERSRQRALQCGVVHSLLGCACTQAGIGTGTTNRRPPPLSAAAALTLSGRALRLLGCSLSSGLCSELGVCSSDERLWRRLSHLLVAEWASSPMCELPASDLARHAARATESTVRRAVRAWRREAWRILRAQQLLYGEAAAALDELRMRQGLSRWREHAHQRLLAELVLHRAMRYVQRWRGFGSWMRCHVRRRRERLLELRGLLRGSRARLQRAIKCWGSSGVATTQQRATQASAKAHGDCGSQRIAWRRWSDFLDGRTRLRRFAWWRLHRNAIKALNKLVGVARQGRRLRAYCSRILNAHTATAWTEWAGVAAVRAREMTFARELVRPFVQRLAERRANRRRAAGLTRWRKEHSLRTAQALGRRRTLAALAGSWRVEARQRHTLKALVSRWRTTVLRREYKALLGRWLVGARALKAIRRIEAIFACDVDGSMLPARRARGLTRGVARLQAWRARERGIFELESRAKPMRRRALSKWRTQRREACFGRWAGEASYRRLLSSKQRDVRHFLLWLVRAREVSNSRASLRYWQSHALKSIEHQESLRARLWYMEELQRAILDYQELVQEAPGVRCPRTQKWLKQLLSVGVEGAFIKSDELDAKDGWQHALRVMAERLQRSSVWTEHELESACSLKQRGSYRHVEREALSGAEVLRRLQMVIQEWPAATDIDPSPLSRQLRAGLAIQWMPF